MSRIPCNKLFFEYSRNFYFYFLMFENYSAFEVKHVSDLSALSKKLFFGWIFSRGGGWWVGCGGAACVVAARACTIKKILCEEMGLGSRLNCGWWEKGCNRRDGGGGIEKGGKRKDKLEGRTSTSTSTVWEEGCATDSNNIVGVVEGRSLGTVLYYRVWEGRFIGVGHG